MPWKSDKQRKWGHTAAGLKALGGKKGVAEWDNASKFKKKAKIVVNNKLKGALGSSEFKKGNIPTGKIEINVKKHNGDRAELASTIKHEMMHVKNPKMTEKEVYKRTAKTKIPPQEQSKLISKLQTGVSNHKLGAMKRKYKVDGKPGDLISKVNESKITRKTNQSIPSKERISIVGMV